MGPGGGLHWYHEGHRYVTWRRVTTGRNIGVAVVHAITNGGTFGPSRITDERLYFYKQKQAKSYSKISQA